MALEPAPGSAHDARRLVGAQTDVAGAERQHEVVPQRTLTIADRLVDQVGHPGVALEPCCGGRIVAVGTGAEEVHVGDEVGEHDLGDAGLAERREHLLDVPEEHPVRSDDEHALILEREPVGVQQVRGAVECDHGLAGARPALHHEHTGLRRPDDLVLFALDGGDDVAERPRAATFERRQQRRIAA